MPQKLLVIDDSPSIRTIIRLYLMGRPLEVLEATDGAQGLQIVTERGVDLVIADYNMPVMDGLAFVKNIREHAQVTLRALPVILLTANKEEEMKQRALAAGASAFASKPISRSQLTATVEAFLPGATGAAAVSPAILAPHAFAEALLFQLGGEVFAFPIGRVRQVLRACWPQPIPRPPLGCLGVIEVSSEVVPVLDLAVLLALRRPLHGPDMPQRLLDTHFLLVGEEDGTLAFWVDRVLEVGDIRAIEDVAADPRAAPLGKGSSSWVVGLAAAGDRRALVLEPSTVVTASRRRLLRRAILRKVG